MSFLGNVISQMDDYRSLMKGISIHSSPKEYGMYLEKKRKAKKPGKKSGKRKR